MPSPSAPPSYPEWLQEGLQHIWHPYTQMQTAPMPLPVKRTQGVCIELEDGRQLIDGVASWWSAAHGYNHPHIIEAMQQQLATMPHVMFAGLAHEPAYRLATRLASITPSGLNRAFFSDSGSVAVEVAMKMAVQYYYQQGKKNKCKFITFRHSYHGDTMGAMSLGDVEHGMHRLFRRYMPGQYVVDLPNDEYGFIEFEALVASIQSSVAGIIIEPLVQGAGGMRFHSADTLAAIQRIAKEQDILFIADEIATGFGRTGSPFACNEAAISPDILCLGKALSGGACSLAVTMATDRIYEGFLSDEMTHAFMHGPTYMANPLACAAANASLDLFESAESLESIERIERQLQQELEQCRSHPKVRDVRVKGAIGVIELEASWQDIWSFRQFFVQQGIWLRPFGNIIYVMPAFTITTNELKRITETIHYCLEQWSS